MTSHSMPLHAYSSFHFKAGALKIHVNVPLVYTDLRPYQMQETRSFNWTAIHIWFWPQLWPKPVIQASSFKAVIPWHRLQCVCHMHLSALENNSWTFVGFMHWKMPQVNGKFTLKLWVLCHQLPKFYYNGFKTSYLHVGGPVVILRYHL